MDSGQWTVDNGQWTVDSGQWTVDSGQWTVDSEGIRLRRMFYKIGSACFIGDRTQVSRTKHFNRSAGRSTECAAGNDRKRNLSARRGVDRKAGRFSSPRLRVLLWSFLPTREESGGPKMIERTINNPANPQICRRWEMREERIATAPCGVSGWRVHEMQIRAESEN